MSAPFGSDPWLDARLRNVPLPVGMLARLNQIPQAEAGESGLAVTPQLYQPETLPPLGSRLFDAQMDAALGDVALPPGLLARLERIGLERRHRIGLRELTIAASIFVAVGVAYAFRSVPLAMPVRPVERPNQDITVDLPVTPVETAGPTEQTPASRNPNELAADRAVDALRWKLIQEANLPFELPAEWLTDSTPEEPVRPRISKKTVFAANGIFDRLPDLVSVPADELPRGLMPPFVPGYDLKFFERYGEHPFVSPSAHKDLQSINVPLITRSTSYQQAWRGLASGKLLSRDEIHLEEFLAAVDYDFAPVAPGMLGVRTAAGLSPFAEPGTRLLQVAAIAGELPAQPRAGTAITVVVDTSASMRFDSRLAIVRRALSDLASQLGERDQFTLIAVSDRAELLVDGVGRDKLGRILSEIQSLEPQYATNIGAGLELACETSLSQAVLPNQIKRIVLLTDGLGDYGLEAAGQMESLLKDAAAQGVTTQICNVGDAQGSTQLELVDRLAKAGGGAVVASTDVDELRFALLETLTGRKQAVAREASLKITFNPQSVAVYRLIGHEIETLTGSTAAATSVELRAGEAATALFELHLQPGGGDDVATAELTWRDADTGESRSISQRISRVQFAKSFAESPLSLQSAAIVGRTAELLRGSQFAGSARSLSPVLSLAAQASPLVTDKPSMRAFLSFVEQAEKVRAGSSAKRP